MSEWTIKEETKAFASTKGEIIKRVFFAALAVRARELQAVRPAMRERVVEDEARTHAAAVVYEVFPEWRGTWQRDTARLIP